MIDDASDPDEIETLDVKAGTSPQEPKAVEPDTTCDQPKVSGLEGRKIGSYSLVRELGHGGQGLVYLAEDTRLHRMVALKIMPDALSFSDHHRLRFAREAEVASRLDHPGICTIYESGEDAGIPFIAMQYIDGESLKQTLDQLRARVRAEDPQGLGQGSSQPISSRSAVLAEMMRLVSVIEDSARAVHHAHEAGLVHRDIKPANIMIKDGRALVLDFGLASDGLVHREAITMTGDLIGTPMYMAAEQLRGEHGRVDRRSDVYALGATLYECVTLRPPFARPSFEGLCRAIINEEAADPRQLNPRLSPELKLVLACAMDKDPDRRYQTAELLADDLRRVRLRQPVTARPVSSWLRARRLSQRHPLAVTLTGTIFLVLTLLTAVFYAKNSELDLKNSELAAANRRVAAQSATARAALADVERLSDSRILTGLIERADSELWPALPEKLRDFEDWLTEADALAARLPIHRELLQRLNATELVTPAQAWQHDVLVDLVSRLEAFLAAEGSRDSVKTRLSFASSLKIKTIDDQQDAWDRVAKELAAAPRGLGLKDFQPQLGLIPLGADPDSGLQEFLHLASHAGDLPSRTHEGDLILAEDTGIILVLIPPQSFHMGAMNDEAAANYDPEAQRVEGPISLIDLDAYFIGKFEVTQAQWKKMTGKNPSAFGVNRGKNWGGLPRSLRQPVEQLSSPEARKVLARHALVLPTEARWECACRAGSVTPFNSGAHAQDLAGYANIGDAGSAEHFPKGWALEPDFDDGFPSHAAVGSLLPNAFGLHDMHGNVWEWCLDEAIAYKTPPRSGDGLRLADDAKNVTARGGSFHDPASFARSASRGLFGPRFMSYALGCRAARELD